MFDLYFIYTIKIVIIWQSRFIFSPFFNALTFANSLIIVGLTHRE